MRSVRARFDLAESDALWGASWAVLCGVAASLPLSLGIGSVTAAIAAWFLAVPLLAALAAPAPTHGRGTGWLRHSDVVAAALCLTLAALLGAGAFALALVGVAMAAARRLASLPPAIDGLARSALMIALPLLIGWVALDGPVSQAPWVGVAEGVGFVARAWLAANWAVPAVALSFTLVHHGATSTTGEPDGARGFGSLEVSLGYALAVASLAVAGRSLSAGAVAILFAVQWPFQARLRRGSVEWYFQSTQLLSMLAMLGASIGAGGGGPA